MGPGAVLVGTSPRRTGRAGRPSAAAALIAVFLCVAGSPYPPGVDQAGAAAATRTPDPATSNTIGALARTTGPRIETTVVAMTLRGVGKLDVLTVPDLDIIERIDGTRFLPLVRLLRVLGIVPLDSASVLVFVPDRAPVVTANYAAGTASIGGSSASVPMVLGISDVTNQPELYVEESAVAAMLSMEVVWDARLYEYSIRANRTLKVFERRRESGGIASRSAFASYDLPGHLPPARARRSFLPVPQFIEIQWLSSLTASSLGERFVRSTPVPRIGLWADVLGGNLAARVSQKNSSNTTGYKTDQLLWSTSFDQAAFSVGNVNLGLSELVFPSLSLIGAVTNGRVGAGLGSTDPSQLGRQQAFLPLYVFDGYARLGSEVTLSINGQDLETRKVEPGPNSPPGDGPYRFEGVNLFSSRLNDVRIRVVTPDGSVEETQRRVLGTNLLMEAGDLAFIGGFGGRRDPSSEDFAAGGRFGGGRLNLGIVRRLMLGMSAAYQDRLYERERFFSSEDVSPIRPPSRSMHLGSRLVWQPLDPLLVSAEAARSQTTPDTATSYALRADADYQLGGLRLHPAAFHYGPTFFDGQNPNQRDLSGASMGLLWRYGRGNQIGLGGSRMHDDLDGRRAQALRWSEGQASWSVHGIVPRSVLTLGGRRIWFADAPALQTGLLGLEGTLPWDWRLRVHHEFGDDIRLILRERLPQGSIWRFDFSNRLSSIPDVEAGIGVGSQTSTLELRRQLGESWQVSLAHRALGPLRRSSIDFSRTAAANGFWQARFSPGYEWDSRSLVLQNRLELFLLRSRNNRLVLEQRLLRHEWYVRFSVQLQTDFGFVEGRPVPLMDSRLDPGSGGVKGRVFLDANANGLADRGEPGLSGIEVMTDQGSRAVSTSSGLFVISNTSALRRTRVSLRPEMLPATYTLTQATQEALLRPGEFTEVNLGLATLGSISGSVTAQSAPGGQVGEPGQTGVAGVRVLLVDEAGKRAGDSITGRDGVFTISDIRPGRYVIRPDEATSPADFVLEPREIPIEVKSEAEPFEQEGLSFTGRYTDPGVTRQRTQDSTGVVYKVFSGSDDLAATPGPPNPPPSRPRQPVSADASPVASQPYPRPLREAPATQHPATAPVRTLAQTTSPMTGPASAPPAVVTPAPASPPEPAEAETTGVTSPTSPGDADVGSRLRVAYGRAASPPAAHATEGMPCECQVEGTVEVRSERPLKRPVVVTVFVMDAPAHRDSVELFMGSPRLFRLGSVPCGSHELVIRTSTSKHFTTVSPIPATFDCVADRLRQIRVVLEPR